MITDRTMNLAQALATYISNLAEGDKNQAQQELSKFVRWSGRDRPLAELTPPEIGEYAELIASYGTAPEAARHLESIRGFLAFVHKQGLVQRNLAQHARFRKSRARVRKGAKGEAPTDVRLTADGYEQLKSRLQLLKKDEVRIAEEIHLAAADKDVRENAPLEAAREQQGHVQSRIRELEATLKGAAIMPSGGKLQENTTIKLGDWVQLKDMATGEETRYRLVGPSEANPLEGKISSASPVGKALLSQAPGQEVAVATPGGTQRYLIIEVSS